MSKPTRGGSAAKKKPHEDIFNFNIIREIRSIVCVESFEIISSRNMTLEKQREECERYYHGEGETIGQVDKFLLGLGVYGNCWERVAGKEGDELIFDDRLHRQKRRIMVSGKNINAEVLKRTYKKSNSSLMTGQTIVITAKNTIGCGRKWQSLMRGAKLDGLLNELSPGEYSFPSGKNEDDFDKYMLFKMYNWSKHWGASGTHEIPGNTENEKDYMNSALLLEAMDSDSDADMERSSKSVCRSSPVSDITPATVLPTAMDDDNFTGNDEQEIDDDANSDGEDSIPPDNYLPPGWVLFKTRGPMAMQGIRMDFFDTKYVDNKRDKNNGRKATREEERREKSNQGDFGKTKSVDASYCDNVGGHGFSKSDLTAVALNSMAITQSYDVESNHLRGLIDSNRKERDFYLTLYNTCISNKRDAEANEAMEKVCLYNKLNHESLLLLNKMHEDRTKSKDP